MCSVLLKEAFCSNNVQSSTIFFNDVFKFLLNVPSAPMTIGTTITFRQLQIFPISLFNSWYFSIFSFSSNLFWSNVRGLFGVTGLRGPATFNGNRKQSSLNGTEVFVLTF